MYGRIGLGLENLHHVIGLLSLVSAGPNPSGSKRWKSTKFKPNGKREVERRLRQIAAGQLKVTQGQGDHA